MALAVAAWNASNRPSTAPRNDRPELGSNRPSTPDNAACSDADDAAWPVVAVSLPNSSGSAARPMLVICMPWPIDKPPCSIGAAVPNATWRRVKPAVVALVTLWVAVWIPRSRLEPREARSERVEQGHRYSIRPVRL